MVHPLRHLDHLTKAGREKAEGIGRKRQGGQCESQGGVVRQLLSLEEFGPLRLGGGKCRGPRV